MQKSDDGYLAYFLRLRRYQVADERRWRVSLEDPRSREVHRFANLDEAVAYLRGRMRAPEVNGKEVNGNVT